MDVRGLTLRSKSRRPQISAPKPIVDPNSGSSRSPGGLPSATPRPQRNGGATSDLVKRRYSAKFNQLPNFAVGEAPPVPSLPANVRSANASQEQISDRPSTSSSSQPLRVEIKALKDPGLQVDNYVANLLANASEQDIREYQTSLRKLKNRTSADLQQSVYQNRTQFIKISKEAEKLKEEMSTLRGLMSELTTALGQAGATTGSNGSPSLEETLVGRRHANRSSVANLESMWSIQLQTLWKTVERSQKFLPAIPGRHIVLESGQWIELDSATWKPRRPVHIVLLNDHLLVAAKKRKRMDPNSQNNSKVSAPTKLVAEECWPLQDIDLIDLGANLDSDSADDSEEPAVPNAVNIRYGPKSFTYRTDQRNVRAKNDLVMTFRKTVEELRKGLKTEAEAAAKSTELISGSQSLSRRSEMFDSDARDKLDILIDVDGKQQNMKWVDGQLDELDINIALQQFEDAVARVEKLRKLTKTLRGNLTAQDVINSKIDVRAGKLAEILIRALVDTHSFLNATKLNISWLTRLGFDDRAREAYLRARSEVMTKRARHCVFEGDLPLYIFQVSFIYFTMIKNTIGIYQQCFPSNMTSACIKWAKGHLDAFNATLSRQLSSVEPDSQIWVRCMDIVHEHAGTLAEVGVDFKNLIHLDGNNHNGHSGGAGAES
ncbi:exocyst complex component exo84 [Coccidioides posadasii str. Silveira]|uniref:Exocyst complex component EXO84 n=1 Tax=Coccidioides posadasii (strain RMSCC 757 / Silveira) TaxID=443226 RepID=E9DIT9_COCPS|nr:exocyst complex component exo84 [Coccidioides posadasii str. Silveira]